MNSTRARTRPSRKRRRPLNPVQLRLWSRLRNGPVHFYRQCPFGPYTVDFYAPCVRLVVECPGGPPLCAAGQAYERARLRWLEARGVTVLCLTRHEILDDLDAVIERIRAHCNAAQSASAAGPINARSA